MHDIFFSEKNTLEKRKVREEEEEEKKKYNGR